MPHPKNGYRINGESVPGVTTIIGRFKESGALMFWAFEQGKLAERGEISKLYENRDAAGESGTLAHAFVEAHIKNRPEPDTKIYTAETIKAARTGFQNYLSWQGNTGLKIVHQEIELVSEIHRFGGCPDAIGQDSEGRLCLLDWKTSKAVFLDYLLQLAAYKLLWEENYPQYPLTGGCHLVRFSKTTTDFSHHFYEDLEDAKDMFLLLRQAWEIDKELKKRV